MTDTTTRKPTRVWVGFVDGKPHVYHDAAAGDIVAVFKTKRDAEWGYEDVRPMVLRPAR